MTASGYLQSQSRTVRDMVSECTAKLDSGLYHCTGQFICTSQLCLPTLSLCVVFLL